MTNEQLNQLINQMTEDQKSELIKRITSDQYVEVVNKMMGQQNFYVTVCLTILGLFIAAFAFYQFGFRKKQLEQMKAESRDMVLKEIATVFEVNDIQSLREKNEQSLSKIRSENELSFSKIDRKIVEIHTDLYSQIRISLEFELLRVSVHDSPISRLINIFETYKYYWDKTPSLFFTFVSRVFSITVAIKNDNNFDKGDLEVLRTLLFWIEGLESTVDPYPKDIVNQLKNLL
jgi:hypothetical protein